MKPALYSLVIIISVGLLVGAYFHPFEYKTYSTDYVAQATIVLPTPFKVTHIKTPKEVKAIYMSSWVAGNKKLRDNLVNLIDTTELNAVVIDIKDYTGHISYLPVNPVLAEYGSGRNRIPDVKEFIGELHEKGIYVIGRISSFQDSYLVQLKPQFAVTDKAGNVWKDRKGISWLDVGAKPVWDYLVLIGDDAYSVGFDELNFDYIRFPSDGDMDNIKFPFSEGKKKSVALKEFFAFLDTTFHPKKIPISADLFGMTTSNNDDLGIGQILGDALIHFDFVAPMVYPSHYPPTFLGFPSPASKPYEVVKYAMDRAVIKSNIASTSPNKLRPWLQDFSIGKVDYTPDMVRAQIQATYDAGLNSWMLWNASNNYTQSALENASTTSH
jgi:hypothetical protein